MSLMISLKSMKIASGQASGGSATGLCQSGPKVVVNLSSFPQREVTVVQRSSFKLQALSFNVSTFQRSTFNSWRGTVGRIFERHIAARKDRGPNTTAVSRRPGKSVLAVMMMLS
jgi:hypothetical protein